MFLNNAHVKVNISQLKHILGVSHNTAKKEYQCILDSLQITNRKYLLVSDLVKYGVL